MCRLMIRGSPKAELKFLRKTLISLERFYRQGTGGHRSTIKVRVLHIAAMTTKRCQRKAEVFAAFLELTIWIPQNHPVWLDRSCSLQNLYSVALIEQNSKD